MKENTMKAVLAAALGALCAYGLQMLVPVIVLAAVMLLDYATGIVKAWQAGELCSRIGISGIFKKVGYLVVVVVAGVADWLLRFGLAEVGVEMKTEFLFAAVVIVWLVINELISILENVAAIGGPVPGFLKKLLQRLKVSVEDKVGEGDGDSNE